MAKTLTKRQRTVIETIRKWIRDRGYPPTIRELRMQLGIKSLRGVTSHLDAIAKKGFLKRESSARSIRLMDAVEPFERALRIPIVGRIRAGKPGLAQEELEGHVVIDATWLGKSGRAKETAHFALKVRGDSMINAGILDGDYVVIRRQPTAVNGEIVAALIGDDATVKRFYKQDDGVKLKPENPEMKPISVGKREQINILGKVVAVYRALR